MGSNDFPLRLELALKALSISRGRLAALLGVDKSVVSRWIKGVNGPTEHNLSNLTAIIAERRPGFTMLDWEIALPRLAEKLGVEAGEETRRPPPGLADWLPARVLDEAMATAAARGDVYAGLWRTTRPAIDPAGRFIHDRVLIRRGVGGLLGFRLGVGDLRFEGWACPNQTQLVGAGVDEETGLFIFIIFNAVLRDRADVLDGLSLTCQRSAGGAPVVGAVLMERTGLLSDDPEADDARYEASLRGDPMAREGSIPEAIRNHLFRDVGPVAMAAGGDALLRMPFSASMSRGPLPGVPFPE
ncbi:MAG: hypothetical protein JWO83_2221 [Caulobacteraceae bacterium]|nr:hypothetical protein [Caulobacteraceae bacterium]